MSGDEPHGWSPDEDMWAGQTEADGHTPHDEVYGADLDPHVTGNTPKEMTAEEAIAARYRLPEEFWGTREMFKRIRQAAWASGNHPDAVLGCVLARAAGAAGHEVTFDSGIGTHGTLSLFVCLLAKAGIGKSSSYKATRRVMQLPSHLTGPDGRADPDVFRDGVGISSGEGLAEIYMGTEEQETGRMIVKGRGRNAQPEPEVAKVRIVKRHRALFFNDEGEALTKLINERQGSTVGPSLRTAWSGGELSQANATEDRYRFVPGDMYSMGVIIGYQPETAVALLSDVGPGTPQRFLWFGAQDTEMPDELYEWPEPLCLPPEDAPTGIVHFPREIKRWLRRQHVGKHRGEIDVDPMDAHEPLMLCKIASLLCYLDGRMLVNRDDWILTRMIWAVSCAIRNRLIRERDAAAEAEAVRKRDARLAEVTEAAVIKASVTSEVEQVARRIARAVIEAEERFEQVKRYRLKKDFGRLKPYFDAGLAHARNMGWLGPEDADGHLVQGPSRPA